MEEQVPDSDGLLAVAGKVRSQQPGVTDLHVFTGEKSGEGRRGRKRKRVRGR